MGNKIGDEKGPKPGRPKGSPNKTTALVKEAILKAAENVGNPATGKDGLIGYCEFLARDEPKAFAQLIGKVLPVQLAGDADNPIEHAHTIRLVGVRAGD